MSFLAAKPLGEALIAGTSEAEISILFFCLNMDFLWMCDIMAAHTLVTVF